MRVYLDDTELPGPIATLATALNAARDAAGGRGRVIVEASADGQTIPDSTLENPDAIDHEPESVRFVTADPVSMVRVALLDAAEALEHARDEHAAVVSALDRASVDEVAPRLERVLSAWTGCIATVRDGGALVGINLEAPVSNGTSPMSRVADLSATLMEVKRCLNAQDWAGLSDAVGDDLERHARAWDVMLKALADTLRRR